MKIPFSDVHTDTAFTAQRRRQRRILLGRSIQTWWPHALIITLGSGLSALLVRFAWTSPVTVFGGMVALVAFYAACRYTQCALMLITIFTTEFIPRAFSLKTLDIYPIVPLLLYLLFLIAIRSAFRSRRYDWPSFWTIWPMLGLVAMAVVSDIMIQFTWTVGVSREVNGNALIYSDLLSIFLYCLPLILLILIVALMTERAHWTGHIVNVFRMFALLAAVIVLIDFVRLHASIYTFRFQEPGIGWITLQGLAMPLGLGCMLAFTRLLCMTRWCKRLWYGGETLLSLTALGITLQNSWWLEVLVGFAVITMLHSRRLLLLGGVLCTVMLMLVKDQFGKLQSVKVDDVNRFVIWQDMLRVWQLHPFLGVGPGNVWNYDQYVTHLPLLLRNFNKTGLGVAHNGYLQVLAELGPIGLLFMLSMLWTLGLACWRLYRRASTSEMLDDSMLGLAALGLLYGSAVADFTSGAFFYLNGQIGGFNALPTLLNNWVIFGLVLYKDQVWRKCVKGK